MVGYVVHDVNYIKLAPYPGTPATDCRMASPHDQPHIISDMEL